MFLNQLPGNKKYSQSDQFAALVLNGIFAAAPIFNYLQFRQITGNMIRLPKGYNIDGVGQGRVINSDYAANDPIDPNTVDIALKIFGDTVKTDRIHEQRSEQTAGERASQLLTWSRSFGKYLTDQAINGNGVGKNADGLAKLIPAGNITKLGSADGLQISTGNSDEANESREQLELELSLMIEQTEGENKFLIMNVYMRNFLFNSGSKHVRTEKAQDALGNPLSINMIYDTPIIDPKMVKTKADTVRRLIMPMNETCGTSTDCTSIICCSADERNGLVGIASGGIGVVDKGRVGVFYETEVETDINWGLTVDEAVRKLSGIRIKR